jgi:hypothetical protein
MTRRAGARRPATWFLAGLLIAAFFTGCGKGGHATTTTAGAAAPPGTGGHPLSRREERAFARRVNITAADVPGFAPTPLDRHPSSPSESRIEGQLSQCLGGPGEARPGTQANGYPSQRFERRALGLESVTSEVSFASSPALARAELARLRSPRLRGCIVRYVQRLLAQQGTHAQFAPVTVAHGVPPAPGTSGGFGLRIATRLSVGSVHVNLYVDVLGFVYGSASVTLTSTGVLTPASATLQQRLYTQLLARATA